MNQNTDANEAVRTDSHIGFIGLGLMGHGAAKHLLKAGYKVEVLAHRKRQAIDDLLGLGATEAASAAQLAERADVVFLCLPDANTVDQTVLHTDGLLAGAHAGLLVVDMTTSLPDTTRRLATRFAERQAEFIDAPLSRTPKEAQLGRLNIMVGGSSEQFARVTPIISSFCENIWHIGDLGLAHTFKLLNNSIVAANIATVLEAAVAADRLGIKHEVLMEICSQGGAASAAMQMIMPYALNGDSSTFQAHTSTLVKDVRYYNQIADDAGGAGFMAKSALHLFQLAAAMGANQTLVPELYDTLSALDGTQS